MCSINLFSSLFFSSLVSYLLLFSLLRFSFPHLLVSLFMSFSRFLIGLPYLFRYLPRTHYVFSYLFSYVLLLSSPLSPFLTYFSPSVFLTYALISVSHSRSLSMSLSLFLIFCSYLGSDLSTYLLSLSIVLSPFYLICLSIYLSLSYLLLPSIALSLFSYLLSLSISLSLLPIYLCYRFPDFFSLAMFRIRFLIHLLVLSIL